MPQAIIVESRDIFVTVVFAVDITFQTKFTYTDNITGN